MRAHSGGPGRALERWKVTRDSCGPSINTSKIFSMSTLGILSGPLACILGGNGSPDEGSALGQLQRPAPYESVHDCLQRQLLTVNVYDEVGNQLVDCTISLLIH